MAEDPMSIPVPRLDRLMALRDALVALKGPLASDLTLQQNLQKQLFNEEIDRRVLGHISPPFAQMTRLIPFGEVI